MFPKHINGITKNNLRLNPSIKENKIENDNKDIKKYLKCENISYLITKTKNINRIKLKLYQYSKKKCL